jgi:hypothetical protein
MKLHDLVKGQVGVFTKAHDFVVVAVVAVVHDDFVARFRYCTMDACCCCCSCCYCCCCCSSIPAPPLGLRIEVYLFVVDISSELNNFSKERARILGAKDGLLVDLFSYQQTTISNLIHVSLLHLF